MCAFHKFLEVSSSFHKSISNTSLHCEKMGLERFGSWEFPSWHRYFEGLVSPGNEHFLLVVSTENCPS